MPTEILAGAECGLSWAIPADQGGDDDAPGGAAAVSIEVLLALAVPAAQPEGVEQQEEQVQSQAGEGNATQQQQGLQGHRLNSQGKPCHGLTQLRFWLKEKQNPCNPVRTC